MTYAAALVTARAVMRAFLAHMLKVFEGQKFGKSRRKDTGWVQPRLSPPEAGGDRQRKY